MSKSCGTFVRHQATISGTTSGATSIMRADDKYAIRRPTAWIRRASRRSPLPRSTVGPLVASPDLDNALRFPPCRVYEDEPAGRDDRVAR